MAERLRSPGKSYYWTPRWIRKLLRVAAPSNMFCGNPYPRAQWRRPSEAQACSWYVKACIDAALEIAEDLLMNAPNYSDDTRLVSANDLLRIVQELNAACEDCTIEKSLHG